MSPIANRNPSSSPPCPARFWENRPKFSPSQALEIGCWKLGKVASRRVLGLLWLFFLGSFLWGAGCQSDSSSSTSGKKQSTLRGEIKIDGSSTVEPIGSSVAQSFVDGYPGVKIEIGKRGTGNGFDGFAKKEIDIAEASRPIKPGELAALQQAGVDFLELPVAYDGLTVVVHPQNDWVQSLTIEQLQQIFLASSNSKTWKDVDPSWPDERMNIFAPGQGSGTYDYFMEVVGKPLREGMSLNEDDNALVTGVAGNQYSIGFFGVAYYTQSQDKLKAVPIVNPEDGQAYLPSKEAVESNDYAPFSRPLFIYVSVESMNRAEMQAFVEFYLNEVSGLVENVGCFKLPEKLLDRARALLDDPAANSGTCFIDSDNKSRHGKLEEIYIPENR